MTLECCIEIAYITLTQAKLQASLLYNKLLKGTQCVHKMQYSCNIHTEPHCMLSAGWLYKWLVRALK